MKTKLQSLINQLEPLVDSSSLYDVTITLSLVACEKAEHIECTWQDNVTARPWRKASNALEEVARVISELGI